MGTLHLNLRILLVEGDSQWVNHWVSDSCMPSWRLLDVVEEVVELARNFNASFSHVRRLPFRKRRKKMQGDQLSRQQML